MEKNINKKLEWIIFQHTNTNHLYDGQPYEYHLKHVFYVGKKYATLFFNSFDDEERKSITIDDIMLSCYGHDLIEDTRVTYNDIMSVLGNKLVVDIIYALTNEKGKTRLERANDKYYDGIRNTKGAVFIKLCDRIANVDYSLIKKTVGDDYMFQKYKSEHINFKNKLYCEDHKTMWDHLDAIFNNN